MRLVTYRRGTDDLQYGILSEDRIFASSQLVADAAIGEPGQWSTRRILEQGPIFWDQLEAAAVSAPAESGVPSDEVSLGPPVPDPDKIICLGLNYRDHARESQMEEPPVPMIFAKFRNSLIGPTETVVLPAGSKAVDYEAELAVVIGRSARGVPAADALDYVAGVMAFNDVTARDLQHATSQWGAGKAIDTFGPCGPALVSLDEIGDVQNLAVRTRVNGQVVQDGSTSEMIFGVAATIEFLTETMTLVPGDIIATGTPAGVGISRDPKVLLADGDLLETEIEGVGVLRNSVTASVPVGV